MVSGVMFKPAGGSGSCRDNPSPAIAYQAHIQKMQEQSSPTIMNGSSQRM
jgi:hypothetical protein